MNNHGIGMLSAIMGALIMSIILVTLFSMLALVGKYMGSLRALFTQMEKAPLVIVCAGNVECDGQPAICLTSHGNDSTLACVPTKPCSYVDGQWSRENIVCDQGILFKQNLNRRY